MAMDVYRELGSFERGLTIYEELDVKQIQVGGHMVLMLVWVVRVLMSACDGIGSGVRCGGWRGGG